MGRLEIGILPTMACRFELRHRLIGPIRPFGQHRQAMSLVIIAREDDLDMAHLHLLGKGIEQSAGCSGTNYPLLVDRDALLFGRLRI